MRVKGIYTVVLSCLLLAGVSAPAWAIQCAIYARAETGVSLYGDAGAWWGEAAGRYPRGHQPVPGAILVFKPSRYIRLGHVAVVSAVVNRREILVDQANWNHGEINHGTPVVDQSPDNDWSDVSVENLASHTQGRDNPTFGFVYPQATRSVILADRDLAGRELPERAMAERAMAERDSYRSQGRPMLRTALAERAEIRHLIAKPVLAEVSDRDLAKAERQNLADHPIADRHGAAQAIAEAQVARVAKKDKNEKRLAKTAGRKRGTAKTEATRLAEKATPQKREAGRTVVAKAESAKARPEAAARDKRLAATKTAEKRLADAHRGDAHSPAKRLAAKEAPHKDAARKDEMRVAARAPAKHEVAKHAVAQHEVAKTVVVARNAAHRPAAPAHLVLALLTVRQAAPKPHPSAHTAAYKPPMPAHAKNPHPVSAARTAGADHRRAHVAVLLHDRRQKSAHRDF